VYHAYREGDRARFSCTKTSGCLIIFFGHFLTCGIKISSQNNCQKRTPERNNGMSNSLRPSLLKRLFSQTSRASAYAHPRPAQGRACERCLGFGRTLDLLTPLAPTLQVLGARRKGRCKGAQAQSTDLGDTGLGNPVSARSVSSACTPYPQCGEGSAANLFSSAETRANRS
jgi:hypothetical protein